MAKHPFLTQKQEHDFDTKPGARRDLWQKVPKRR